MKRDYSDLNLPKEILEKFFLKKYYYDSKDAMKAKVMTNLKDVGVTRKYPGSHKLIEFKYKGKNESDVTIMLEKIYMIIKKREDEILKKYKNSYLQIIPSKQISKLDIQKLKEISQLEMQLIVSFVMGLIISILFAVFLTNLENRKRES